MVTTASGFPCCGCENWPWCGHPSGQTGEALWQEIGVPLHGVVPDLLDARLVWSHPGSYWVMEWWVRECGAWVIVQRWKNGQVCAFVPA